MRAPCTLTEAVLIVGLCLFAIGSARAVGSAHQEEKTDRNAMNRVDAQQVEGKFQKGVGNVEQSLDKAARKTR